MRGKKNKLEKTMFIPKIDYTSNNYSRIINKKETFTSISEPKKSEFKSILYSEQIKLLNRFKEEYNFKKIKPLQYKVKQVMDYAGASVGLILSSPIILISGVLIKIESKGPVIFKQIRVGKDGKEFTIYKLRTMYNNAPNVTLRPNEKDPRVTKVGEFLRKFSIDELPQFLNMLKGNMSLIGPRPHSPKIINELIDNNVNIIRRFVVKPGARIHYNGFVKHENDYKIILDAEEAYLKDWNLKKDFKMLFKTFKKIISGKNV